MKNEFMFYRRISRLSRSVRFANGFKNVLKLNTAISKKVAPVIHDA